MEGVDANICVLVVSTASELASELRILVLSTTGDAG